MIQRAENSSSLSLPSIPENPDKVIKEKAPTRTAHSVSLHFYTASEQAQFKALYTVTISLAPELHPHQQTHRCFSSFQLPLHVLVCSHFASAPWGQEQQGQPGQGLAAHLIPSLLLEL